VNEAGQLGDGTKISRNAPRPVVGLTDVAQVSRGDNHTCAVTTQGALYCWGGNEKGQLGDGTLEGRTRPVRIDW
jgi:alpha-tubulin suppressor-like RCC1 family protein